MIGENDRMLFNEETLQKWANELKIFVCSLPKVDSGLCFCKDMN